MGWRSVDGHVDGDDRSLDLRGETKFPYSRLVPSSAFGGHAYGRVAADISGHGDVAEFRSNIQSSSGPAPDGFSCLS